MNRHRGARWASLAMCLALLPASCSWGDKPPQPSGLGGEVLSGQHAGSQRQRRDDLGSRQHLVNTSGATAAQGSWTVEAATREGSGVLTLTPSAASGRAAQGWTASGSPEDIDLHGAKLKKGAKVSLRLPAPVPEGDGAVLGLPG